MTDCAGCSNLTSNPSDNTGPPSDFAQQDRQNLLALSRGNTGSLDRVVAGYKRRVFRYIFSRLNNVQACEDLTQDVFMRLCRGGYDGRASPSTWIFTIARRRMIDFFRAQSRRPATTYLPQGFEQPERQASDPAGNLLRRDEDQRIRNWLAELPEEQAEAVRLRVIVGLSFAQTAEALDCSVPTAKSRLRYGLSKLRTLIQEETQP
jgi:RNA polymerase sigma-70 factor (ECF subfamily)